MPARHPTAKAVSVKDGTATTVYVHGLGNIFLNARHRHDDLEHRPGRKLRLNGFVQQWLGRIRDQRVPFLVADANRESVRVKRRPADHGEDLAGMRIHCDHRAVVPLKRLFGSQLDVEVDRQLEGMTRDGRIGTQSADFFAMAVHESATRPILADKNVVIKLLNPALSHDGSRLISLILRRIQIFVAHLADIADQVRQESVFGIEATMNHDGFKFRQFIAMGFNECLLIRRDVVFEQERSILIVGHAPQALMNIFLAHVQTGSDFCDIGSAIFG